MKSMIDWFDESMIKWSSIHTTSLAFHSTLLSLFWYSWTFITYVSLRHNFLVLCSPILDIKLNWLYKMANIRKIRVYKANLLWAVLIRISFFAVFAKVCEPLIVRLLIWYKFSCWDPFWMRKNTWLVVNDFIIHLSM